MPATTRRPWSFLFRPAPRSRKAAPVGKEARPCLEALEDRVAPAILPVGPVPTTTTINPIAASIFSLFSQAETVTTQTNITATGLAATSGQVTITDGGQTHVVSVNSNGQASTTFTFSFFQEQVKPHPVNASFSDSSGTFASNTATTVQAPDNTIGYLFQLYFDLVLYQSIVASSSGG
jgi:hypothetical protein